MERDMTILLSSHNLPELYQTATDYIIIDRGVIKKTITAQELEEQCKEHLLIRVDKSELAADLIERDLNTKNYLAMPDKSIRIFDYSKSNAEAAKVTSSENTFSAYAWVFHCVIFIRRSSLCSSVLIVNIAYEYSRT